MHGLRLSIIENIPRLNIKKSFKLETIICQQEKESTSLDRCGSLASTSNSDTKKFKVKK